MNDVERVARALHAQDPDQYGYCEWDELAEHQQCHFNGMALVALAAHKAALADAGLVIVPRVPTEAMCNATDDMDEVDWLEADSKRIWQLMVEAAP